MHLIDVRVEVSRDAGLELGIGHGLDLSIDGRELADLGELLKGGRIDAEAAYSDSEGEGEERESHCARFQCLFKIIGQRIEFCRTLISVGPITGLILISIYVFEPKI